jgi:hypothetical protein
MIIICLFTFLFYPPCNINRALDKSRDFVNMCYVLLCVAGWLLGPHMIQLCVCVCCLQRGADLFFPRISIEEREREKRFRTKHKRRFLFWAAPTYPSAAALVAVSHAVTNGREREREARELLLYM